MFYALIHGDLTGAARYQLPALIAVDKFRPGR
jgi:hypothetical protein